MDQINEAIKGSKVLAKDVKRGMKLVGNKKYIDNPDEYNIYIITDVEDLGKDEIEVEFKKGKGGGSKIFYDTELVGFLVEGYTPIEEALDYKTFKVPKRDIQKMTEYLSKGSNPKTLANTVKDIDKAVSRYYISVSAGWEACEDSFYNRCIDLGVSKEDLKIVRDRALKDKSIDIGSVDNDSKKEDKPRKTIQANQPKTRKTIDSDSGLIIKGNNDSTPFS